MGSSNPRRRATPAIAAHSSFDEWYGRTVLKQWFRVTALLKRASAASSCTSRQRSLHSNYMTIVHATPHRSCHSRCGRRISCRGCPTQADDDDDTQHLTAAAVLTMQRTRGTGERGLFHFYRHSPAVVMMRADAGFLSANELSDIRRKEISNRVRPPISVRHHLRNLRNLGNQ